MLKEYRDFIVRGDVLDLAVAIIIGGAFGAIVTSLVDGIILPLVGIILGSLDLSGLSWQVGRSTIAYGHFLQAIVNFLIIGLALFLVIKAANTVHKRQEAVPVPVGRGTATH